MSAFNHGSHLFTEFLIDHTQHGFGEPIVVIWAGESEIQN